MRDGGKNVAALHWRAHLHTKCRSRLVDAYQSGEKSALLSWRDRDQHGAVAPSLLCDRPKYDDVFTGRRCASTSFRRSCAILRTTLADCRAYILALPKRARAESRCQTSRRHRKRLSGIVADRIISRESVVHFEDYDALRRCQRDCTRYTGGTEYEPVPEHLIGLRVRANAAWCAATGAGRFAQNVNW